MASFEDIETKKEDKELKILPESFGPWQKYIEDDDVTDIDYNGTDTWVRTCHGKRFCDKSIGDKTTKQFVLIFTDMIQTAVSKEFNKLHPLLEAETKTLRISIVHESRCNGRRSICIRKTPTYVRIETRPSVESGYASPELLSFLRNAIKAHFNLTICGRPGVGKTEFAKYVAMPIPDNERVITIEDNLEWHYHELKPTADCVEMQVSQNFDYYDAIKACLRQNPDWIMVSEVRGKEVANYLQQLTTGVHGVTTVHTDDVRNVPDRLCNMAADASSRDRIENDIYNFLDIAVLVDMKLDENGLRKRYVSQVCIFMKHNNEHHTIMVFDDGKLVNPNLPPRIFERFFRDKVENPFINDIVISECKGLDLSSLDKIRYVSSEKGRHDPNANSEIICGTGEVVEPKKNSKEKLLGGSVRAIPMNVDDAGSFKTEKRKEKRYETDLSIAIQVVSTKQTANAQIKNVSLRGIGFVCATPIDLSEDTKLFVQINIPYAEKIKRLMLLVDAIHSNESKDGTYFGCCIREISAGDNVDGKPFWKNFIKTF